MSEIVMALFAFLFGLAFCFAGYRFFLVMLPIWGFFAGFWLGAEAISLIFGTGFLLDVTGIMTGFFTGLIVALLSYVFYTAGIAFVAASFGASLGAGFMGAFGFDGGLLVFGVAVVCGLIMMVLVLVLNIQKYVIIAITAFGGANALILSAMLLFGRVNIEALKLQGTSIKPMVDDSWFWMLAWLIIAAMGIATQLRINRTYSYQSAQYVDWG